MKKGKNCLIAMMLVLAILLYNVPIVNANDKDASRRDLVTAQEKAVSANEALMQYFFSNGWITEYPEYYGGSYIADNVFYIRLVSPSDQTVAQLKEVFLRYADAVMYEFCNFSQTNAQTRADEVANEFIKLEYAVTHWYVESKTGNIVVGMLEEDIDKAKELLRSQKNHSQTTSAPSIIIEKGEYFENKSDPLYGGTRVGLGTSGVSVGACGYYNGASAFVSCGHGNFTEGSSARLGNSIIGTVAKVQYANQEVGDYSITVINDAVSLSHKVGSNTNLTVLTNGTYLSPATGTYVSKYGARTGYSYGTVTGTNISARNQENVVIRGLTMVTLSSGTAASGDSGGTFMVGNAFCGVLNGVATTDGITRVTFTPYSIISSGGFAAIGMHQVNSWWDAGDADHAGYCTICEENVFESHAAYWNHTWGYCQRCGRTGSIFV